jgi:hypothetical protein
VLLPKIDSYIRKAEEQRLLGQYISKVVHSGFLKHLREHNLSIDLMYAFLKSTDLADLRSVMEGFMMARLNHNTDLQVIYYQLRHGLDTRPAVGIRGDRVCLRGCGVVEFTRTTHSPRPDTSRRLSRTSYFSISVPRPSRSLRFSASQNMSWPGGRKYGKIPESYF